MLLNVACKAFLVREGKILLLRLAPKGGSEALVGSFDLPGGRLMPGESFADVLQRELWEEIGTDIGYDNQAAAVPAHLRNPVHVDNIALPAAQGANKTYEPAQYIRLFFRLENIAIGTAGIALSYEHDDYIWVAPADAAELVLFPGIAEAIAAAFPKTA